jgi:uncharacterized protein
MREGMAGIKQIALTGCGSVCVALGVAGLFLPIVPTTPFLLLAAWCYARSSRRVYAWLMTNRWCGAYIRNYREGRGISRAHKTACLLLLWLAIGSTAGFAVTRWWVRLALLAIAVAVTVHVLRIKTCRPTASGSEGSGLRMAEHDKAMGRDAYSERKGMA